MASFIIRGGIIAMPVERKIHEIDTCNLPHAVVRCCMGIGCALVQMAKYG